MPIDREQGQDDVIGVLRAAARHPHKGPHDTDAAMLREAAKRLRDGHEPGGAWTKWTIANVISEVADMLDNDAAPPSVPAGSDEQPEPVAYCAHCGKGLNPGDPLCDHTGEPTPIRCAAPGCDGEHVAEVTIAAGSDTGTTDCTVEHVRAFVDDGECSACGAPVPSPAPEPVYDGPSFGDYWPAESPAPEEPMCCHTTHGGLINRDECHRCRVESPIPPPAFRDEISRRRFDEWLAAHDAALIARTREQVAGEIERGIRAIDLLRIDGVPKNNFTTKSEAADG